MVVQRIDVLAALDATEAKQVLFGSWVASPRRTVTQCHLQHFLLLHSTYYGVCFRIDRNGTQELERFDFRLPILPHAKNDASPSMTTMLDDCA